MRVIRSDTLAVTVSDAAMALATVELGGRFEAESRVLRRDANQLRRCTDGLAVPRVASIGDEIRRLARCINSTAFPEVMGEALVYVSEKLWRAEMACRLVEELGSH